MLNMTGFAAQGGGGKNLLTKGFTGFVKEIKFRHPERSEGSVGKRFFGFHPQNDSLYVTNCSQLTAHRSHKKAAFTLAEVLITLGIIGVVAVLTIPALVAYNQEKGWNTSAKVFEAKLNESLNVMNTQQVLSGYKTTEDFVNELQKHMKITKVCQNDDILSCFEDKVTWNNEEVDMESIKKASHFGETWDTNTNLLGLQFANGTGAIVGYDTKCKQDPFSNQIMETSCIAMLYDTSGFANPNEQGKDLRSINVKSLNGKAALCLPNGTCFTSQIIPKPINCEEHKEELGIKECNTVREDDAWANAVAACGGIKNMPTMAQLKELAEYLYPSLKISDSRDVSCSGGTSCRDESKFAALNNKAIHFYSGEESEKYPGTGVKDWYFGPNSTGPREHNTRMYTYAVIGTLCIAK